MFKTIANLWRNLTKNSANKKGHGPWTAANSGYPDAKPYIGWFDKGIFEGHDGSLWKYFRAPQDVATAWQKSSNAAVDHQEFLVDACKRLAELMDSQSDKVRNDVRREFHISLSQTPEAIVSPWPEAPAAAKDFYKRMGRAEKAKWYVYVGFQILPGNFFDEAYGFVAKWNKYFDIMRDPDKVRLELFSQDLKDVTGVMLEHGFTELDFINSPIDLEQLTAWHGDSDDRYGLARQLQNVRSREPIQGLSMLVPKWDEVMFHALKPIEGNDVIDPESEKARWMQPVFHPASNVVACSVRGQLRAPSTASNIFNLKHEAKERSFDIESMSQMDLLRLASTVVHEMRMPMFDNVEIVLASLVPEVGTKWALPGMLRSYDLEAAPLIGRQALALNSTMPCFPHHIMRIPRGNGKRPHLVNVMLPGMLAMSGMFRSTKPAGPKGLLVGLTSGTSEFNEVWTETDAAKKYNGAPAMLVTGATGAGKTMWLCMQAAQLRYQELPVWYLNFKAEGTLSPFFNHIGGTTISMDTAFLDANPGMLDPILFLKDRRDAAKLITDCIFSTVQATEGKGVESAQWRAQITAEVNDCAVDLRNRCTYDVLFGNGAQGEEETKGISDKELSKFVRNKMKTQPFWKAFIARTDQAQLLAERVQSSPAVLIEWDKGMSLPPSAETPMSDYNDAQMDTVLSMSVVFNYAAAAVNNTGGAIIADESWVLKRSKEAMHILERAGRTWRQADTILIMASQRIRDWIDPLTEKKGAATTNMSAFFDRYLFMALPEADDNDLDLYYEMTKLPRNAYNTDYIRKAGVRGADGATRRKIPCGYYMDNFYSWSGGVVLGPWPEEELNAARTDKNAINEQRRRMQSQEHDDLMAAERSGYAGAMLDVLSENVGRTDDDNLVTS